MAQLCLRCRAAWCFRVPNSVWGNRLSWLLMFGACLAMPLSRWIIKKFMTWPRTGYVVQRRDKRFWVGIAVAMVIAAVVPVLLMPHLMQSETAQLMPPGLLRPAGRVKPGQALPAESCSRFYGVSNVTRVGRAAFEQYRRGLKFASSWLSQLSQPRFTPDGRRLIALIPGEGFAGWGGGPWDGTLLPKMIMSTQDLAFSWLAGKGMQGRDIRGRASMLAFFCCDLAAVDRT